VLVLNHKGGKIMKAGVRNQFAGEIIEIKKGTVMAEVIVKAGDHEVTSVMTLDSLADAGFKVGNKVTALVKAVNVVLVK
jgi:molybdate transport system regulatory protein